jgi:hypothetical protein
LLDGAGVIQFDSQLMPTLTTSGAEARVFLGS